MLLDEVGEFTFFNHVANVRQAPRMPVLAVRMMVVVFSLLAMLVMTVMG